jgi:hypothetical protein
LKIKTLIILSVIVCCSLASNKIGIGVDLFGSSSSVPAYNFRMPIQLTDRIRVEPLMGMYLDVQEDTGSSYMRNFNVSIGSGINWIVPLGSNLGMYLGPKVLMNWNNYHLIQYQSGTTITDTIITRFGYYSGMFFGAEYRVSDNFTISGEFGFMYSFGRYPQISGLFIYHRISTLSGIVFRWYVL